ncbi:AraC family transcriptional regulator [Epibacterium sp. MM17-32]|uniref:helix-turn-helix domain-containing protein n=1 Tax=Epibacterium sp. MM17-32 TaxID=2917734 RepID=UPI001EF64F08|nr:AraC family transcriptional regulator [Epibacterium sp. MM17-32]MCG7626850.1 AraC family transcriptional regulator [Epibacterium sp. MM17-32]
MVGVKNPRRKYGPRRLHAGQWSIELLPQGAYEVSFTPGSCVVGFAFDPQKGTHAFASDKRRNFETGANTLALIPAGCDVFSCSDSGGEYLRLSGAGAEGRLANARRFSDRVDRRAVSAAYSLRRQMLRAGQADPLECEALASEIATRAAQDLDKAGAIPSDARCMTGFRMRRINDLIEDRIGSGLTVSELADAIGLSPGYFTRSFTAAVGRSPQQYIIDRRLARARALLADSTEPLTAIAIKCGFASHAHMTAQFQKRLGLPPSHFERRRWNQNADCR